LFNNFSCLSCVSQPSWLINLNNIWWRQFLKLFILWVCIFLKYLYRRCDGYLNTNSSHILIPTLLLLNFLSRRKHATRVFLHTFFKLSQGYYGKQSRFRCKRLTENYFIV
jgi:hypothetical protein